MFRLAALLCLLRNVSGFAPTHLHHGFGVRGSLQAATVHENEPVPCPGINDTVTAMPTKSTSSSRSTAPLQVQTIETPLAFLDRLDDQAATATNDAQSQQSKFVVVEYFASYCKLCQRAGMIFKKIAMENSAKPVSFHKLEASRLPSDTLRTLGVTKFPYIQIFYRGDCVASFSTGASHVFGPRVRDTIDLCLARSDEEWQDFGRDFGKEIQENRDARRRVQVSLQDDNDKDSITDGASSSTVDTNDQA